jgi:Zn-finger protein
VAAIAFCNNEQSKGNDEFRCFCPFDTLARPSLVGMTDTLHAPSCSLCTRPTPSVPPPLSWSPAIEDGTRVWTCPDCARENIRNIEGRLDQAWW